MLVVGMENGDDASERRMEVGWERERARKELKEMSWGMRRRGLGRTRRPSHAMKVDWG